MTPPRKTEQVLPATWYPHPDDLIGGWCVMTTDAPPSAGGISAAEFTTEEVARHIAALHNEWLAGDRVTVSRDWLTDALTRLDVRVLTTGPAAGMINAESMADAIMEALAGDPR